MKEKNGYIINYLLHIYRIRYQPYIYQIKKKKIFIYASDDV